jgi:hypothetical protein
LIGKKELQRTTLGKFHLPCHTLSLHIPIFLHYLSERTKERNNVRFSVDHQYLWDMEQYAEDPPGAGGLAPPFYTPLYYPLN